MRRMLAGLALATTLLTSSAETLTPARFLTLHDEISQLVKVPTDLPEDFYVIRCTATAVDREIFSPACEGGNLPDRFRQGFVNRLSRALDQVHTRVETAKRNGREVAVIYPFSILIEKTSDAVQTRLIDNHLYDYESYGMHYIAPQRILNEGKHRNSCGKNNLLIVSAAVDTYGRVTAQELVHSKNRQSKRCIRKVHEAVEKTHFIPAQFNQQPVRGTHVRRFDDEDKTSFD